MTWPSRRREFRWRPRWTTSAPSPTPGAIWPICIVYYEDVEFYPLEEIQAPNWNPKSPDAYRVEKMKYAGKRPNLDTSTIHYNAGITLTGIPAVAHEYKLGTRSALDWLIDRYQVRTHSKSGIVNDPNDWAEEAGDPRYILDLIKRVTTVSVRTVEIVNGLPELPILM